MESKAGSSPLWVVLHCVRALAEPLLFPVSVQAGQPSEQTHGEARGKLNHENKIFPIMRACTCPEARLWPLREERQRSGYLVHGVDFSVLHTKTLILPDDLYLLTFLISWDISVCPWNGEIPAGRTWTCSALFGHLDSICIISSQRRLIYIMTEKASSVPVHNVYKITQTCIQVLLNFHSYFLWSCWHALGKIKANSQRTYLWLLGAFWWGSLKRHLIYEANTSVAKCQSRTCKCTVYPLPQRTSCAQKQRVHGLR